MRFGILKYIEWRTIFALLNGKKVYGRFKNMEDDLVFHEGIYLYFSLWPISFRLGLLNKASGLYVTQQIVIVLQIILNLIYIFLQKKSWLTDLSDQSANLSD